MSKSATLIKREGAASSLSGRMQLEEQAGRDFYLESQ